MVDLPVLVVHQRHHSLSVCGPDISMDDGALQASYILKFHVLLIIVAVVFRGLLDLDFLRRPVL